MRIFIFNQIAILSLIFLFQGFGQGQENTSPLVKCWDFAADNLSGYKYASDNEKLYLASHDNEVFSLDKRGQLSWKSEFGENISSDLIYFDNKVYFLTSKESESVKEIFLHAISANTGISLWHKAVTKTSKDFPPIFRFGSLIVVRDAETNVLWEMDAESGNLIKYLTLESDITSNISFGANSLFYFSQSKGLEMISAGDSKILTSNLKNSKKTNITNLFNLKEHILAVSNAGEIIYLDRSNGLVKWKSRMGASVSDLSFDDYSIFLSSVDNYVYRFSRKNGDPVWRRRLETSALTKYLPVRNLLVSSLVNSNKTVFIDAEKGKVVNQIALDGDNYLINVPFSFDKEIILFHRKGISAFQFADCAN